MHSTIGAGFPVTEEGVGGVTPPTRPTSHHGIPVRLFQSSYAEVSQVSQASTSIHAWSYTTAYLHHLLRCRRCT
jgi:hypothetical protein